MHFFGQVAFFFGVCLSAIFVLMLGLKFSWLSVFGIPYHADFIETPLPALAATFFLGAVMALLFGVLGELLVRIYFEVEGRFPFSVETVEKDASTDASTGAGES